MSNRSAAAHADLERLVKQALALADELGLIRVGIHLDTARVELGACVTITTPAELRKGRLG